MKKTGIYAAVSHYVNYKANRAFNPSHQQNGGYFYGPLLFEFEARRANKTAREQAQVGEHCCWSFCIVRNMHTRVTPSIDYRARFG